MERLLLFQELSPVASLSGHLGQTSMPNSRLAVQMRAGGGRVLATTFRFDQYGTNAYATRLLDSMIEYVASDECRPDMRLSSKMEAQR